MARYKLKFGVHEGADPNWKPKLDKDGNELPNQKAPAVRYAAGDVVESDVDLVAFGGEDKFTLLSGGKTVSSARKAPTPTGRSVKTTSAPGRQGQAVDVDPETGEILNDNPSDETPDDDSGRSLPGGRNDAPAGDDEGADDEPEGGAEADDEQRAAWLAKVEKKHGPLEEMTVADLKEVARKEKVDLAGCHTKAEIVAAVKAGPSAVG